MTLYLGQIAAMNVVFKIVCLKNWMSLSNVRRIFAKISIQNLIFFLNCFSYRFTYVAWQVHLNKLLSQHQHLLNLLLLLLAFQKSFLCLRLLFLLLIQLLLHQKSPSLFPSLSKFTLVHEKNRLTWQSIYQAPFAAKSYHTFSHYSFQVRR